MIEEIDAFLRSSGWTRSTADHNLYYVYNHGNYIILLLIFVDDLLLTRNDPDKISKVKTQPNTKYIQDERSQLCPTLF